MDRDEVEVHKNVKRERAILTELAWSIKDLLYGIKSTEKKWSSYLFIFEHWKGAQLNAKVIARAPISWLDKCRKYNHLIGYISLFHSRWRFFWFHKDREITKTLFTLAESNFGEKKTFVHSLELWRNFIFGNETGSPGRAVSLHLARSGSQSEHRIRCILPARGACHIIRHGNTL